MSKSVTSVTIFQDAVGTRLSATYSEVDDNAGIIIADNKRINRIVTDATMWMPSKSKEGIRWTGFIL